MATHSNTLAWKVPWTEEPGRLQSMGLQRVSRLAVYVSFCRIQFLLTLVIMNRIVFLDLDS